MPPRGVKKGTKRARQYEKIKRSARSGGASASRAREMAARTVNKNRARSGESLLWRVRWTSQPWVPALRRAKRGF